MLKGRKIISTLLLFVILIPILATTVYAVSNSVPITVYVQPKSNWCWVMVGGAIVRYVKGWTGSQLSDSAFAMAVQGSYDNIMQSVSVVHAGMSQYISCDLIAGEFSWEVITSQIDTNKPLYVAALPWDTSGPDIGNISGHAVVASGYVESGSSKGVYFEDPAAPYGNITRYSSFSSYNQIAFVMSSGTMLYNKAGIWNVE